MKFTDTVFHAQTGVAMPVTVSSRLNAIVSTTKVLLAASHDAIDGFHHRPSKSFLLGLSI